jgi:hypothetical protein
MNPLAAENAQSALFAAYLLCSVALNGIALLISLFYRKKFHHPSPRWGFFASIVFSMLYCALLAAGPSRFASLEGAARLLLACGALASVICTVNLFLIMQKVRK